MLKARVDNPFFDTQERFAAARIMQSITVISGRMVCWNLTIRMSRAKAGDRKKERL